MSLIQERSGIGGKVLHLELAAAEERKTWKTRILKSEQILSRNISHSRGTDIKNLLANNNKLSYPT